MKDAVHRLVTEWDECLHLAEGTYWKIEGVTDPQRFFSHLPKVFPHGSTLLIEGLEMGRSAKSLYEEHPAIYRKKVACDTISPTPESYHVAFTAELADCLCRFIRSQGLAATFCHFKGYSEREILFIFHDAFEGELVLSNSLSETAIHEFVTGLGCTAKHATFGVDYRAQLIAIDRAMNPPWWRRILKVFKRNNDT